MTHPRRTPARTVRITGRGLHSGRPVQLRIHPGGDGIVFRHRDDRVTARPDQVTGTTRCTSLGPIAGVEHLMSAFAGLEITDAEVELTHPELPGLDGSAAEFAGAIRQAGTENLGDTHTPALREGITVRRGDAWIHIRPGQGQWTYTYDLSDRRLGTQTVRCRLPDEHGEIADARTIAFLDEVPALLANGFGLGMEERTVIAIGDDGYHNTPRHPDEPARHKLLDLAGDLYLAGVPLGGLDVTAHGSGHTLAVRAAEVLHTRRMA